MFKLTKTGQIITMTEKIQSEIQESGISIIELIAHFKEKCKICGHHRIMHDHLGACEGVMNKPCTSGCDTFKAE